MQITTHRQNSFVYWVFFLSPNKMCINKFLANTCYHVHICKNQSEYSKSHSASFVNLNIFVFIFGHFFVNPKIFAFVFVLKMVPKYIVICICPERLIKHNDFLQLCKCNPNKFLYKFVHPNKFVFIFGPATHICHTLL